MATASMIRMFAWCGMKRSISSGRSPAFSIAVERRRRERLGREAVGLLPLHPDVVLAAGDGLRRRGALGAAGREPDHVGAFGRGRQLEAVRPGRFVAAGDHHGARRRRRRGCRSPGRCSRGSGSAAPPRSPARSGQAPIPRTRSRWRRRRRSRSRRRRRPCRRRACCRSPP